MRACVCVCQNESTFQSLGCVHACLGACVCVKMKALSNPRGVCMRVCVCACACACVLFIFLWVSLVNLELM